MGTLTVKENLFFSAALRLPTSVPWSEKKERVEKVIKQLGLTNCADTKVLCYCIIIIIIIIIIYRWVIIL